ncbi:MAG: CBS domain-containing protein [Saprospiraceae bacterium]|nr:CBS domain-containing protein [Saprospiraceae bacterium]
MSLLPQLASGFIDAHPDEAAQLFEKLPTEDIAAFLLASDAKRAAAVLQRMSPALAGSCLAGLTQEQRNEILLSLPLELLALMIRPLDEDRRAELLKQMPESLSSQLEPLLLYPAGTAGAMMDSRIGGWSQDMKVSEALQKMHRTTYRVVAYLYVVDRDHKLVGVISYWDLTEADPDLTLQSVMHPYVDHLRATAPQAAILAHPAWNRFHALPVTDEKGRFLGVLRYKTRRQLEGETVDDLQNPVHTALALGELCWTGMTAVWDTVGTMTTVEKKKKVRS